MANIKIRLVVKTGSIRGNKVPCHIVDNVGKSKPGENPTDHCTKVDPGQTIEWSGLPENPNVFDQVSIDSITYNSGKGKDLFGVRHMVGVNGNIFGTIIARGVGPKDEETYEINFTVIKANGTSKSYCVDPKLQIH